VTTRVDTINLLEKRVKSRFSGRILRTAAPSRFESWLRTATDTLCSPVGDDSSEWSSIWTAAVDKFMTDSTVLDVLKDTYALSRDFRMLCRILVRLFSRGHGRGQPLLIITLAGDTDSRTKAIRAISFALFAPLGSCCPTTPAAFPPPTWYAHHTIQQRHSPQLNATKHSRDLPINLSADRGNAPGNRRAGHHHI
jgi:origin recognition complex subunit 4